MVMGQADIVSRDRGSVMWQWQCHVFVILSQFDPNFFKTEVFSSQFKLRQNLTFI